MRSTYSLIEAIFKTNSTAINSNLLTVLYKWCSPSTITTMNSEQLIIFQKILSQYVAMNPNFHAVDNNNKNNNTNNSNNSNNSNSYNTNNRNPIAFKRDFQKIGVESNTPKNTSATSSFGFAKQLSSRKRLCIGSNNIFDSANSYFIWFYYMLAMSVLHLWNFILTIYLLIYISRYRYFSFF